MRIAVGAVYQTLTRSRCRMPYQRLGIELRLGDDAGHAVGQWRDDAVAGAGDPAGIGRAPEDVVIVQIERIDAGDVMRDHRLMHMDRALGSARGAAGEVQQGAILGICRRNDEVRALRLDKCPPVERARRHFRGVIFVGHQDDVVELRQLRADRRHLAAIQCLCRHQHAAVANRQPRRDRFRSERGEQRRDDALRLQGAEHRDVEFGNAPGQHEHAVAFAHAETAQGVGEAVGCRFQVAVGEGALAAGPPDPAQRLAISARAPRHAGPPPRARCSARDCRGGHPTASVPHPR